jgi:hypothetical protein
LLLSGKPDALATQKGHFAPPATTALDIVVVSERRA